MQETTLKGGSVSNKKTDEQSSVFSLEVPQKGTGPRNPSPVINNLPPMNQLFLV